MTCEPTNSGAMNAKSAKSYCGACNTVLSGRASGSTVYPSIEVLRWPPLCEPTQPSNGSAATEAPMATGDDYRGARLTAAALIVAIVGAVAMALRRWT